MDVKEKRFEADIESYMITEGGFLKGNQSTYDREKAVDLTKLVNFIKETQPKEWQKYIRNYGLDAELKLYKRFQESVEMHGMLYVLKHGFEDRGAKIKVIAFKHNSNLGQTAIHDYNANVVECIRQFKYSKYNENSIDIVLSINGIPLVAMELKDQLTGQSIRNAKEQFKHDRNKNELCFRFDSRFLVYFAVDLYEVAMTTKLDGDKTFFLPFNQGSNGAGEVGGAGNPKNDNGYVVDYLWKRVLTKDSLLNIIQRYMQKIEETTTVYKNDVPTKQTSIKLIFPRYHQMDVVEFLVDRVRRDGTGQNYLIQHSAGSGKSNSIAWLAYQLADLHDENDEKVFTSIIVINDRKVLDRQTQNTIFGFDHVAGVVETIDDDKHSSDLKDAINDGKQIIITTLQKFPVIYKEINSTSGRRFAVIVDEAHSSQSGKSAMKMKTALADTEEALREYAELEGKAEDEVKDSEDKLVEEMITHGKHKNLSFFAFTATPKRGTLETFGIKGSDGEFRAHHIYSMRQAIEENFILDVLKNYSTYKNYYRLVKSIPDNPQLPAGQATRAAQTYVNYHQHNLQVKSRIIIETFKNITQSKIDGRGKAMVVTASRLHAVKYYFALKEYIKSRNYDINVLVAFSDSIKIGEEEYTEEKLNKRADGTVIKEDQLPAEFKKDTYKILVVAEKYQTGFDEPLLHTMFVDKKLKDVKTVQTLSRLNRTTSGKKDTFVLDFVNSAEEIQDAFKRYYECTLLDEEINVNLIYDTKNLIRGYGLYNDSDVDKLIEIVHGEKQKNDDIGRLTSLMVPVVNRYKDLPEEKRFDFKKRVKNFNKWYSYITQITRLFDRDLQREYNFTMWLEKVLPRATEPEVVNLTDKLKLEFYKLEETFKGNITLNPTIEDETIKNVKTLDTQGRMKDEDDLLENIISKINERFHGAFKDADRVIVETIYNKCLEDDKRLLAQAKRNDEVIFGQSIFPDTFKRAAQDCYVEQMDAFSKLFEDKAFYNLVMTTMAKEMYKDLRNRM